MSQKASTPKGTRDFSPSEMAGRNYIFETIRDVFARYAYLPIETPAMENLTTLTGKYGEEGDKLLFRILNSGDYLAASGKFDEQGNSLGPLNTAGFTNLICDKGLRYDLTVPFARYVVQHRGDIVFPFKRYQIQPVWRADRPQKGRYREFYQCDVDVIGSNSLLYDAELLQIASEVFSKLSIPVTIRVNHRRILAGIAEYLGSPEKFREMTTAIDKFEKIGADGVNRELKQSGFGDEAIQKLLAVLNVNAEHATEMMHWLEAEVLSGSETGLSGLQELKTVFGYLECQLPADALKTFAFDPALARGLSYYTGTIIEVKANGVGIGSICGGGRYDDLTGVFGMPGVSGTGISFGADRIYDVLNEMKLFPPAIETSARVLVVNFGKQEEAFALKTVSRIREAGIAAEIYPEAGNLKKQFSYADHRKIPLVLIAGPDEISRDHLTLKNMKSGEQIHMHNKDLIAILQKIE
ncbi:MAG TPA: histidine--tRNA ligase [Bacteroidales bacterium]|nr:histidine--tRNA ligase [Bacteroidales bacterium]HSA42904.1 histidine--tRNA ligase [Bacteroidales bacterium]